MIREMKEVKLPWVKEIPVDYDVRLVKNLFSIGRGRVIAKTDIDSDNNGKMYPVYSSQTANDGCMGYIPSYDYEQDSLTWTTDGANAGTVFLRSGKFNCTNVCGILTLRNNDKYYLPFFGYSVNLSSLNSRRSDILGHKVMSNEMARFSVVFPINIEEQRQIVAFLDRKCSAIDTAIEKTKKSIEKLEEYKKAVITKAVTKGLDPDAKMKDSGVEWIGKIPETWNVQRIKFITSNMGSGTTPSSDKQEYYDGDIAWIQSGDLYNTPIVTDTAKKVTSIALKSCSALKIYKKPYLVLAMYGASVGNISKSEIDACTNQACCIIKPNKNNDINYLMYWLDTCKDDFIHKSVGGGQPNISQDKVREQNYLQLPLSEQRQIVFFLDRKCSAIDTTIEKTKKSIEKLEEYKKSIIYYAVTGKIDCRNEQIEGNS